MTDTTDMRSRADYAAARTKASFRQLLAFLTGRRNDLLSFEQVREKLRIGGPIYRGVQTVRVDHIIGSVNRYKDFDRAFLPRQDFTADRWQRVNRAWYEDVSLPPVLLYKVGEVYFVVDGHHRVSVARQRGQEFIDAEIREVVSRVPVTPDLRPEDLELLGSRVDFLERTQLDRLQPEARIEPTILGGYDRLIEHIAVHRYFMGIDQGRPIEEEQAVRHWYDSLYRPVVEVIEALGILEEFPARTASDLYLWVSDHLHYLREQQGRENADPAEAAAEFIQGLQDE